MFYLAKANNVHGRCVCYNSDMNEDKVFIYWDNSNIWIAGKSVATDREGQDADVRMRIHFQNLLRLAHGDRDIGRAVAAGSVPPELRHVWNHMENNGVEVYLLERGAIHGSEQGVDQILQLQMLQDTVDHNGDPGIAVILTGDGRGFGAGTGFHANLERMRKKGWKVEVLSWQHSCNRRMLEWAKDHGKFIALDDFYESITFLEQSSFGNFVAAPRSATPLDLTRR